MIDEMKELRLRLERAEAALEALQGDEVNDVVVEKRGVALLRLREVEEELRRSEIRYRELFEHMTEGFALHEIITDPEGRPCDYRFLQVNPAFERLTGLKSADVIGECVREVLPEIELFWIETYGRVALRGEPAHFERFNASLGKWFEVFAYRPAPKRFAIIFTDITERKRVEKVLARQHELLMRIYDRIPVLFVVWDPQLRKFMLNRHAETVLGWTTLDANDGDFMSKVYPDDAYRAEAIAYMQALESGWREWIATTKDGRQVPIDWANIRLTDDTRIGIGVDLRERKEAEKRIRSSLREKEVLLREIHHRVKNNLQVISSLVSLRADHVEDPALREIFNEVRDRVRAMALVHEKLYESGGPAQLDFAAYVSSLMQSLCRAHGANAAGVRLHLNVEPVPLNAAEAVPCGLILNELASNALKHAFPEGNGDLTVSLTVDAGDARVSLRVQDGGVGFPPDLDWRSAKTFGLRLVHMLAEQLGGTVEIGRGPGTDFRVTFPLKDPERLRAGFGDEDAPTGDRA